MNIKEVFAKIKSDKKNTEFLPTGFEKIDKHLDGGLLRKELVILGAGTGIGKSAVAGSIFWNLAMKGFKCGYFSLEIANEMILARITGAETNIKPTRILYGLKTKEEHDATVKAEGKMLTYKSFVGLHDDIYELEKITEIAKKEKYEFIVVDFIQNVIYPAKDEYTRLSMISLLLQKFAKENNVCVLVLSQLSNRAVREGDKTGVLEYKGSGSIATVADLGFFITREDPITDDKGENPLDNIFNISLRKNRRGISGLTFPYIYRHPGGKIDETQR